MEEGLPKIPKLELAQMKFVLSKESNPATKSLNRSSSSLTGIKDNLLSEIIKDSMFIFFYFFKLYINLDKSIYKFFK